MSLLYLCMLANNSQAKFNSRVKHSVVGEWVYVYTCVHLEGEKTFGKLIAGKKRNDIAKKSTTTMKNVLYRITTSNTLNTQTFSSSRRRKKKKKKKKNMYRWNKLLVVLTTSAQSEEWEREKESVAGVRKWKNQSIWNDFTGIWNATNQ